MSITAGRYRHYKGGTYEVICLATQHDSREVIVVYKALYGDMAILARSLSEFEEEIDVAGRPTSRYQRLED